MSDCIAIVSDLIFASRIAGTATKVGVECQLASKLAALDDALEEARPNLVLVDMDVNGNVAEDAIRSVKSRYPDVHVIAFCSHVETDRMEQAKAAGADDVWPRSLFVQRLPAVLEACTKSAKR